MEASEKAGAGMRSFQDILDDVYSRCHTPTHEECYWALMVSDKLRGETIQGVVKDAKLSDPKKWFNRQYGNDPKYSHLTDGAQQKFKF